MPECTFSCGSLCRQSDAGAGGAKCALCPLASVYHATSQILPVVWAIDATEIPQPQQRLLVHRSDMTSTLEKAYGARTHLRLLRGETENGVHQRVVVLALDGSERPVEFGAISIHLSSLSGDVRREVVLAERPLGGLLLDHGIKIVSRPKSYIRVEADALIRCALELDGAATLYGRCNALFTPENQVLADIVEILPP
jgi:chorismate-pyruvate lyase